MSPADANLFCRPGNATGVVNAEPEAFFFTDTVDEICALTTMNKIFASVQHATTVQRQLFLKCINAERLVQFSPVTFKVPR